MTKTKYITRADQTRVTEILSEAYSRTLPCEADEPFRLLTPDMVDKLGYPVAELQEVEWEIHKGIYGSRTLLKDVAEETESCDDCGGEGWYDQHGDQICRDCGMVLNHTPMLIPQEYEANRTPGPTAGAAHNVFFNDGTERPAINTSIIVAPDEPDVQ